MNFSSYNFKLNGAQHLKDNGNLLALAAIPSGITVATVKAESYATTMARVIASAAMTGADVTLAADVNDLKITVNGKSIDPASTALVTDDLVLLILDTVNSEVIICQDATDRIVTNEVGDMVTIPALIAHVRELSAV